MPITKTWAEKNVEKLCTRCKTLLPVNAFQFRKAANNDRHARCRACRAAIDKARRPEALARERAWAAAHPDGARLKNRKEGLATYGLTTAGYDELLAKQNGRCAICKTDNPGRKNGKHFDVDHCHDSNLVRGLLCHSCNLGIGHLKDSPELLKAALRYLEGR